MTNISSIKTYTYCPRKVYIQENISQEKTEVDPIYNKLKLLNIDIEDVLNKNMRKLKRNMNLKEVENTLFEEVQSTIEKAFNEIAMGKTAMSDERIREIYNDFNNQTYYNIKLLSLKAIKTMELMRKDGDQISGMFFPSSMNSYFIKDDRLDLTGVCDKIEIIDGNYFPISFKNSNPPIKGVWNQDAIELAAQAILIEQEFDCDVYVGFVEYQKIVDRRPVVMDVNVRRGVFEILHEMNQLKLLKKAPTVKINEKKCEMCEYEDICLEKKV